MDSPPSTECHRSQNLKENKSFAYKSLSLVFCYSNQINLGHCWSLHPVETDADLKIPVFCEIMETEQRILNTVIPVFKVLYNIHLNLGFIVTIRTRSFLISIFSSKNENNTGFLNNVVMTCSVDFLCCLWH